MEYYFLYNYGNANNYRDVQEAEAVDTTVTLKGEGKPYILNAWTGEVTAAEYEESNGTVKVNVHLAPNDSTIIVLSNETLVQAKETQEALDNTIEVKDWNLTIESWTMGETVLDTEKTVIEVGKVETLKTWNELDEALTDVSGIGTYTATFTVDDAEGKAAYIHMGHVKDAYGVKINGKEIIVDQVSGDAEITDALKNGENEIEITVATSLLNAILNNNSGILNDEGRVLDDRSPAGYGLFNEIVIDGNTVK
jgi:hypothetical protein